MDDRGMSWRLSIDRAVFLCTQYNFSEKEHKISHWETAVIVSFKDRKKRKNRSNFGFL